MTAQAKICEALGIEGPEQAGPDYATLAPVLDLSISGRFRKLG